VNELLPASATAAKPWRWGHFLRLPGPFRNPLQGSGSPVPAAQLSPRRCRAADGQAGSSLFSVGQPPCGTVFCRLRAIVEKRNRAGLRRARTASSSSTPAAVMWKFNLVFDRGTIFGSADQRRNRVDPDVAAASGAAGSTATRRARQPRGPLAHAICSPCPQDWLQ